MFFDIKHREAGTYPEGKKTIAGVVVDEGQPRPQRPPEAIAALKDPVSKVLREGWNASYLIAAVSSETPSPVAP